MYISIIVKILLVVATAETVVASGCGCRSSPKPNSCQEIKTLNPSAKSGYYTLTDRNGEYNAYCDMDSPCGGSGWTKIADVNMDQNDQECPEGLRLWDYSGVRVCIRHSLGCNSAFFSSHDIPYSEVCGRVIAYQYASSDAFYAINDDINSVYVDGVSITRGFPREHIWTYATGLQDTVTVGGRYQCPCNSDADPDTRSAVENGFVGDDYYCESGIHGNWQFIFYPGDKLFDNEDCGPLETECCNKGLLPYFYKDLGTKSDNDIEFRICADEGTGNEDTSVSIIELYIR